MRRAIYYFYLDLLYFISTLSSARAVCTPGLTIYVYIIRETRALFCSCNDFIEGRRFALARSTSRWFCLLQIILVAIISSSTNVRARTDDRD